MTCTRRDFMAATLSTGVLAITGGRAHAWQAAAATGRRAGDERTIQGVRLCWCPSGTFTMGSPPTETGHRGDEAQAAVTLTRGFWMATFETTQGDWRRVGGPTPDRPWTTKFGLGDDIPAYWITFDMAEAFCARLTERARSARAIDQRWEFRLPTEAQWEYACRAGTTTATAFGNALHRADANFGGDPLAGGRGGPAPRKATPVGSYRPNAWGLCDMHGNVFEWCRDWYHSRLPGGTDPDLSATQGIPNRDGSYSRVRRGGAWNDDGWACRSALRLRYEPHRSSDHIGCRVALVELS